MAGIRKMARDFRVAADEEGEAPFPPKAPPSFPPKGVGKNNGRNIPNGYEYSRKALKPLAKILWSLSVSLGHGLTAYKQFARLKSSLISPDGMIGGRGYIMGVPEIRKRLHDACESLSAVLDTVHDEVNAPHWKPPTPEEEAEAREIQKYMDEAEEVLKDPEEAVKKDEEKLPEPEEERFEGKKPPKKKPKKDKEPKSGIPSAGDPETVDRADSQFPTKRTKQGSYDRRANSSEPIMTLPGGPRVDHLDRGEQVGPYGSFNVDDVGLVTDDWAATEGTRRTDEYDYQSEWDNEALDRLGVSGMPDATHDDTKTDGFDFGIGYGAKGEGVGGYGELSPGQGTMGVFGPEARLPNDPGGKSHDDEPDTTAVIEQEFSSVPKMAEAELPNDGEDPVARSDYYSGDKGNMMNTVRMEAVSGVPGDVWSPATKPIPRDIPENTWMPEVKAEPEKVGESGMPGDESVTYQYDKGAPTPVSKFERIDNPYVKWDDTTHNMRPDLTYERPQRT